MSRPRSALVFSLVELYLCLGGQSLLGSGKEDQHLLTKVYLSLSFREAVLKTH